MSQTAVTVGPVGQQAAKALRGARDPDISEGRHPCTRKR